MPGVGQTLDYQARPSMSIALKISLEAVKK